MQIQLAKEMFVLVSGHAGRIAMNPRNPLLQVVTAPSDFTTLLYDATFTKVTGVKTTFWKTNNLITVIFC